MNPEENQPVENAPTTAPEMDSSTPETPQQSVPLVDAVVPPVSQPAAPTVEDTISPEPQQVTPQATTVSPTAAEASTAPTSGVVNATQPITETNSAQTTTEDPGHTLGVVGLILAIFIPVVGLIISIVARSKSKKAGHKNGLALAGIIVSIVSLIVSLAVGALIVFGVTKTIQFCDEKGPGTHTTESGATITCNE